MDDITDSVAAAWKEAMRGVRKGYKKTKSVLKQIPMDKLRMMSVSGGVMSSTDIRRFFQLKYGAEVRNDEGERMAAAEASDVESSEEEALTDAQVQEKVDKKYFDKTYDPVKFELERMEGIVYTNNEAEGSAQREAAEAKMLELRQKCAIVSTTLKRRVLAHHHSFVSGTEKIRNVNDSLLVTSSDCKKARAAVRRSKAAVSLQIALLCQQRVKENLEATITLLEAMKRMTWKRNQLMSLISSGKVSEAASFVRREGVIDSEDRLSRVFSMRPMLADWRQYRDDPKRLVDSIEVVLTSCLTNKFIASTYRNVLEASQDLDRPSATCSLVTKLLWKAAIQILCKSLTEVSYVKKEDAPLDDIADGIQPNYLIFGVRQMAAKLMDFLYLFTTVVRLHEEERYTGSPYAALHSQALQQVLEIGHRIGCDLIEKLTIVLSHARLTSVGPDHVLHHFVIVSMLAEAISVLGLNKNEIASARTQTKMVLLQYMHSNFQLPKAREVLSFMSDDDWQMSAVSPPSLNMVKPLSPESYRGLIKAVKQYLQQNSDDGATVAGAVPTYENPFVSEDMLVPRDTSSLVQTQTFGAYLVAARERDFSMQPSMDASQGLSSGNTLVGEDREENHVSPTSQTDKLNEGTLISTVQTPPSVLTSSALFVANAFLEYQARIAVRFPPLAADIVVWCEDLLCLYFYTVVDSFVSVSRSVPVEQQGDFSVSTRRILAEARTAAERAVGAVNGQYSVPCSAAPGGSSVVKDDTSVSMVCFPLHVWGRVRSEFANAAEQYAVGHRAIACQSVITLVFLLEAAVQTMSPVLSASISREHLQRCRRLYTAAHEVLHICVHRLCQAIYPMESICSDIAKVRSGREVVASAYVEQIVKDIVQLNKQRKTMPTPVLETLFMQRFVFAVQCILIREYGKLLKKHSSDLLVMQLQVDVQALQQQLTSTLGQEMIVLPNHVVSIVKAGFFAGERDQIMEWVRLNHRSYTIVEMVNWFSTGNRTFKVQLEDLLTVELKHQDTIPTAGFVI